MESMPDEIIQLILSQMSNARHVASCSCVSKSWNNCIPFIPSLHFTRNVFDGIPQTQANAILSRMVTSAARLEELIIFCPFLVTNMASWLSLHSRTLRVLELRMDLASEDKPDGTALGCTELASGLEVLRLWSVILTKSPDWGTFASLQTLEIYGAEMNDDSLNKALDAFPNLIHLALLGCHGVNAIVIEMESLESCRLDFLGLGNRSVSIRSPRIRELEIQGFSWIHVDRDHCLARLCIAYSSDRVYKVEVGKLAELEYLCLCGVQWTWNAIDSLLRSASEVKHLIMKISFCGNSDTLEPFPEVDLVDFFNGHPKLKTFEIHGAMFAALCQKNSLKKLNWRFSIPCLEEVVITVRSPLNAEQKLRTLDSLVKYSRNLRKMAIRFFDMKGCHDGADDFCKQIARFQFMNNRIVELKI